MKNWEQKGFAVVSFVGPLPMVHSFHMPEWEAKSAMGELHGLPAHLIDRLQVLPATLTFQADGGGEHG